MHLILVQLTIRIGFKILEIAKLVKSQNLDIATLAKHFILSCGDALAKVCETCSSVKLRSIHYFDVKIFREYLMLKPNPRQEKINLQ